MPATSTVTPPDPLRCTYYAEGACRSCGLLGQAYARQLADKQSALSATLAAWPTLHYLPPVPSAPQGFRNKAKMVVGGSWRQPTLGILDVRGQGVDLRACPLYPESLRACFAPLAEFIRDTKLPPYRVDQRRGELKYLLLTEAEDGALMLRFVLRSEQCLGRIRARLPWLRATLPRLSVISANLQPEHKAIVEGPGEILLYGQGALCMSLNGLSLWLRPRSFFQTNTAMAAALYGQARGWVQELRPATVWDLYCGVGGFALHLAAPGRAVLGIEIEAEAVASARRSAEALGLSDLHFAVGDASAFVAAAGAAVPELVVVNPPRRGLGPALTAALQAHPPRWLIYSSCNAESLARDLAAMPALRPCKARLLDMFPQTPHYESIVLLERLQETSQSAAERPAR